MKKISSRIIGILTFIILASINIACQKNETNDSLNLKNGIVVYMPPPDNCNDYIIKFGNKYYKPSNLSDDFKQEALEIKFEFNSTEKTHNCGFGGPISIIDLTHIEKR